MEKDNKSLKSSTVSLHNYNSTYVNTTIPIEKQTQRIFYQNTCSPFDMHTIEPSWLKVADMKIAKMPNTIHLNTGI